jgi:hypothetical protein
MTWDFLHTEKKGFVISHLVTGASAIQHVPTTRVLSPARRTGGGGLEDVTSISASDTNFVSFRLFLSVRAPQNMLSRLHKFPP